MILTSIQSVVQQKLQELFTSSTKEIQFSSVAGGCINETYRINFDKHQLFCKINSASKFPQLFEKEKNGLELISGQNIIKTPGVIDCFESDGHQILLLEYIEQGTRTESFWKKFGEHLAAFHRVSNKYFGLNEDNYMGSIPQLNKPSTNWIDFFIHQRLEPLSKKCLDKNLLAEKHQCQFENLYKKLPAIFDIEEKAALVHGDLWSGNFMCNKNSAPVLIDPAVHFGHHSIDLGMTSLFGGFQSAFYEAYNYHSPFVYNYKEQWKVCNLYPLLIHLALFGKTYLSQIDGTLNYFS